MNPSRSFSVLRIAWLASVLSMLAGQGFGQGAESPIAPRDAEALKGLRKDRTERAVPIPATVKPIQQPAGPASRHPQAAPATPAAPAAGPAPDLDECSDIEAIYRELLQRAEAAAGERDAAEALHRQLYEKIMKDIAKTLAELEKGKRERAAARAEKDTKEGNAAAGGKETTPAAGLAPSPAPPGPQVPAAPLDGGKLEGGVKVSAWQTAWQTAALERISHLRVQIDELEALVRTGPMPPSERLSDPFGGALHQLFASVASFWGRLSAAGVTSGKSQKAPTSPSGGKEE